MSLKPAGELAQKLILFFFFFYQEGKILSITGCPTKFLKGTHDTHKKEVMLTIFSPSHQPKFH